MAIPYSPPSVRVQEVVDPSVAPLIAAPSLLALVGPASGEIEGKAFVTFTASKEGGDPIIEDAAPIGNVPNGAKVVEVKKVEAAAYNDDAVWEVITDYTVQNSGVAQSDSVNAATITRVTSGGLGEMPQGVIPDYEYSVQVTFTYIPEDYFSPVVLSNLPDAIHRFGAAWDTTGATAVVGSPLTFAAEIAFENGASEIAFQPLFKIDSGNRVSPSGSDVGDAANWTSTFEALRVIGEVNLIVPVIGQNDDISDSEQLQIVQTLQDHIRYMREENQEFIIGVFGEADTSAVTMQSHAYTLAARHGEAVTQQLVMVSPSSFLRPSRSGGLIVGGQYVAAAIAGQIAARPVYQPLTRKPISGFVEVLDTRTKAGMNEDAAAGMLVVERKNNVIQIRHAITLDTRSTPTKELSIVRAKHRVIESVQLTIDEQIIGQVVADGDAAVVVRSAIIGVLDQLRGEHDIVSYTDVQSRISSLDPTTVEVRFSYAPAFPVNYVNVVFSLDLSGGAVDVSTEVEDN